MPESSASAGNPVAAAAWRALASALPSNVSSSSRSSASGASSSIGTRRSFTSASANSAAISFTLCALRVATTTVIASLHLGAPERLLLQGEQLARALLGQRHQRAVLLGRERLGLGGALQLDELAPVGHDEVEVDVGGRVLVVGE